MKLQKLSSVTLLSVLALGMVAPTVAKAETETADHSLAGTGKVTFEEDNETNKPTDPEENDKGKDKDKEIDGDIEKDTKGGPITIDVVSNLDFGLRKISATPEAKVYDASPVKLKKTDEKGNVEEVERGNYIQWTDKRAGNDHSYEIKAALTKQFATASGTNTLKGTKIQFTNGLLNSDAPQENWPKNELNAVTIGNGKTEGESAILLTNASEADNTSRGLGTYTAEFGTSTEEFVNAKGDKGTGAADKSVTLTVPGGQSIVAEEYKAEITWSIEYTPAAKTTPTS